MRTSRFSPRGSAVRGLVIVLGCLAVVWLCAIAGMSAERQTREIMTFLGACVVAGLLVLMVKSFQPKPKPVQTYWLSPNGGDEITGPFTVAQIVAMWKAGQITTQGMVTKEGVEQWVPILAVAEAFDDSLAPPAGPSFWVTLARASAMAILILIFFSLVFGGRSDSARRPPHREKTLGEQLNEFQSSPRGQQIKAEALAEFEAEQKAAAARTAGMDARVKAALEMAAPKAGN